MLCVERLRAPGDLTVVCGDTNILPDSRTLGALADLGLEDLVGAADTRDLPLRQALRHASYAEAMQDPPGRADALYRLVHSEVVHVPEIGQVFYEAGPMRNYANLQTLLQHLRARGDIDYDDLQAASEHFMSSIVGRRQLQLVP